MPSPCLPRHLLFASIIRVSKITTVTTTRVHGEPLISFWHDWSRLRDDTTLISERERERERGREKSKRKSGNCRQGEGSREDAGQEINESQGGEKANPGRDQGRWSRTVIILQSPESHWFLFRELSWPFGP